VPQCAHLTRRFASTSPPGGEVFLGADFLGFGIFEAKHCMSVIDGAI